MYFDSDGDTGFSIGYPFYAGYFYLDDFIFISGQCLWTSDYAIPKEPVLGLSGTNKAKPFGSLPVPAPNK